MTLSAVWLLVPDGLLWVFHKLLICCYFPTKQCLGFIENGQKNINARELFHAEATVSQIAVFSPAISECLTSK